MTNNTLDPIEDMEEWAQAQWDNFPDIETDLQFGLNFFTYEFNYCIAYFSYWIFKIDMRLNPEICEKYPVELMKGVLPP